MKAQKDDPCNRSGAEADVNRDLDGEEPPACPVADESQEHHGTGAGRSQTPEVARLLEMLISMHGADARADRAFAVAVMQSSHCVLPIRLSNGRGPGWAMVEADLIATAAEHQVTIDMVYLIVFSPQGRHYARQVHEQGPYQHALSIIETEPHDESPDTAHGTGQSRRTPAGGSRTSGSQATPAAAVTVNERPAIPRVDGPPSEQKEAYRLSLSLLRMGSGAETENETGVRIVMDLIVDVSVEPSQAPAMVQSIQTVLGRF